MSEAKITFLARYYPPSPNINGESVCDMVEYLEKEKGIKSNIICTDRFFAGGGKNRQPSGNVIKVKTLFKSDWAPLRFLTFLYDGFNLVRHAKKYRNTLIIVTTSPPLLPFWASKMLRNNYKWALWTLDLFPEGFAATGKISFNSKWYKWVKRVTYQTKPKFLITLGPKQHKHLEKEYNSEIPATILPCGVFFYADKSEEKPAWYDSNKTTLGYCGNLNDPHNADFVKAVIDEIDPNIHQIILALYGTKASEVKAYAEDKEGIVIVDSVPRNQLHFIDIHLVTLTRAWTHIAVPSKAVSAITMGGAIMFCGSQESDNWFMFKENGWFVDEEKELRNQIRFILGGLNEDELKEKRKTTNQQLSKLQEYVLSSYNFVAQQAES